MLIFRLSAGSVFFCSYFYFGCCQCAERIFGKTSTLTSNQRQLKLVRQTIYGGRQQQQQLQQNRDTENSQPASQQHSIYIDFNCAFSTQNDAPLLCYVRPCLCLFFVRVCSGHSTKYVTHIVTDKVHSTYSHPKKCFSSIFSVYVLQKQRDRESGNHHEMGTQWQ